MTTICEHLEDFLTDLRYRRNLRPNTIRAYRYDLLQAATYLPQELDLIVIEDIERWLLSSSLSESTRQRRIASLAHFFSWAQRHHLCAHDPTSLRQSVRSSRRLPNPIRHRDHLKKIEATIQTMVQPYRLILILLRETGMRVSEVLNLNWNDVVLEHGREALRLRETKNGRERWVILEPHAMPQSIRGLRAWQRKHRNSTNASPVFCSNRKMRMSYSALYHQWQCICKMLQLVTATGQPLYTLHQLRHTRATELIDQGFRLEIVQRILGHRDPRSTQGYADISESVVRHALANHHT